MDFGLLSRLVNGFEVQVLILIKFMGLIVICFMFLVVRFLVGFIGLFDCANPINPTLSTRPTRSPEPSEPIGSSDG